MDSTKSMQSEWFGETNNYVLPLRNQARSWNAYLLFYEQEDLKKTQSLLPICQSMQSVHLS